MVNRLADATSPYLLQHQDNPVDWREWSPEAFAEARERGVPVLLSVGYAACHWCHVMAHESFEDEATAAYMNEHFVNIKVDREERPDVDAVYMQATQAMTGQGGWPMTVVMTPEGEPFFCGTYFPDRPRHGQPAFTQVLQALTEAWRERRDQIDQVAADVRAHLRAGSMPAGDDLTVEVLDGAVRTLVGEYDDVAGGFGRAPKFPPSMVLEFLLRASTRPSDVADEALRMVDGTMHAMARGGLYDQLGGGFARYSVDRDWVVPHFEKMLYDNAQLLGLYARWWRRTGDPLGERVVRETAAFLVRELGTAEGGLASALDADSEGEEGRFYVWTPEELREVLGDDDGAWAAELLSVTEEGTFENGASTLQLRRDPDDPQRWERVRRALFEARETRVRPARDDKVVAAWNGLAVASLAEAGALLEDPEMVDAAARAARLLLDVHLAGDRLLRVSRDGAAGAHAGVLEDHACLAGGLIALFEATSDPAWLAPAERLLETALSEFAADDGGWFDTAAGAETLLARPRDPSDNASPSGHSALLHALLDWASLTGSGRHRDAAEAGLRQVHALATRAPRFAGWSLAAAEAAAAGPIEVVVVGEEDDPGRASLLSTARSTTSPGAVVVAATPGGVDAVPLLEGRGLVDGLAAAYVCRGMLCRRPVTTVDELLVELSGA
jgi:uncharacterized protein YyaL (SSP411 family)